MKVLKAEIIESVRSADRRGREAQGGIAYFESIAKAEWTGQPPGKTLAIGGGNTVKDCVRTSGYLSSDDVSCIYRRTDKEMPAQEIEIIEAKEEGV